MQSKYAEIVSSTEGQEALFNLSVCLKAFANRLFSLIEDSFRLPAIQFLLGFVVRVGNCFGQASDQARNQDGAGRVIGSRATQHLEGDLGPKPVNSQCVADRQQAIITWRPAMRQKMIDRPWAQAGGAGDLTDR